MRVSRACTLLALALSTACYSMRGGGLAPHVKTVAILPFENNTATPEVQRELSEALRKGLQDRLGLREAAEDRASAVVRGTIVNYEIDVPVTVSANPAQATASRRRLRLVVDITILDQVTGRTLWEKKGASAEGDYTEGREAEGRRQAIDRLVNDVIEGAQSQW